MFYPDEVVKLKKDEYFFPDENIRFPQGYVVDKVYSEDYPYNGYRGRLYQLKDPCRQGKYCYAYESDLELSNKNNNKNMSIKYYRVKKENFLWDEGAILSNKGSDGKENSGYTAIDEIFDKEQTGAEYITARIVEGSPEWFERVYAVNLLTKTVYKGKEEARELMAKNYKE